MATFRQKRVSSSFDVLGFSLESDVPAACFDRCNRKCVITVADKAAQASLHGCISKCGSVVVLGKMPQNKTCRAAFHEPCSKGSAVNIGEVTVVAEDTRLEVKRVEAVAEHFDVVVCLEEHAVRAEKSLLNGIGDVPQIGADSHGFAVGEFNSVAAGLAGVVGRVEAAHAHTADIFAVINLKAFAVDKTALAEIFKSEPLCKNRCLDFLRQHRKTLCVVAVLVGHENCLDSVNRKPVDIQRLFQTCKGNTVINEDTLGLTAYVGAVALA